MDPEIFWLAMPALCLSTFDKIHYKSEAGQRNINKYSWSARDYGTWEYVLWHLGWNKVSRHVIILDLVVNICGFSSKIFRPVFWSGYDGCLVDDKTENNTNVCIKSSQFHPFMKRVRFSPNENIFLLGLVFRNNCLYELIEVKRSWIEFFLKNTVFILHGSHNLVYQHLFFLLIQEFPTNSDYRELRVFLFYSPLSFYTDKWNCYFSFT